VNHLVLIRVVSALASALDGAVFSGVREEAPHRFRFSFDREGQPRSLLVSLRPEAPWIGRPAGRWHGPRHNPGPWATRVTSELRGSLLAAIEKPDNDRWVRFRFREGPSVVAELATHGANLLLLDAEERLVIGARRPRAARARCEPGTRWSPPDLPPRLLDPIGRSAADIDEFLDRQVAAGETRADALRRRVFGVGREAAQLVESEAREGQDSWGQILRDRLTGLREGREEPLILSPEEPLDAAREGRIEAAAFRLLPWTPHRPDAELESFSDRDPASTVGRYHEAQDWVARTAGRSRALIALLSRQIDRTEEAARAARDDLERFDDPQQHQRWGEALLAGLSRGRREGDCWVVPDPYREGSAVLKIPARGSERADQAAQRYFKEYRRAQRGRQRARDRVGQLTERARQLADLLPRAEQIGSTQLDEIEAAMRSLGLPVGLVADTRAARLAKGFAKPRIEGVRMHTSREGETILVGRSGKENHRLTFKLAAAHDFWFHAQDCPGAHVVLRNDERRKRPSDGSAQDAAELAAWFSDARRQPQVDVQWAQRKYVRRPRGAAPGTVVLKRFQTIRVRPRQPAS